MEEYGSQYNSLDIFKDIEDNITPSTVEDLIVKTASRVTIH